MTTAQTTETETALAKTNGAPSATGELPARNYVSGFDGMATAPFADTVVAALVAPIPEEAVEVKPDGIVYLPGVFYRQRLTQAFGPGGWALAPRGPARTLGNLVTYSGALYALGRFVSEAVGECQYIANNPTMSYASALEGARTDCLTRCCKDLLIAMELWDPSFREGWLAKWALKAWHNKDGKNKLYYWRRDRERPYQVKDAPAEPARGPGGERPKDSTSTPASPPPSSGASHGGSPPSSSDAPAQSASRPMPGDPSALATEAELDDLAAVLKDLRWKKQQITNWTKKHFGKTTPDDLTSDNVTAALELLTAWRRDYSAGDERDYPDTVARLLAAGRVLA